MSQASLSALWLRSPSGRNRRSFRSRRLKGADSSGSVSAFFKTKDLSPRENAISILRSPRSFKETIARRSSYSRVSMVPAELLDMARSSAIDVKAVAATVRAIKVRATKHPMPGDRYD
jgi:hypothetical protein